MKSTLVYRDNVSTVYLSTNRIQHQRTKHVEIDLHFMREHVAIGVVRVLHVPTTTQFVDIFTNGLPTSLVSKFRSSLNIRCGLLIPSFLKSCIIYAQILKPRSFPSLQLLCGSSCYATNVSFKVSYTPPPP
jgi:hypothetical protein